jgi:hypothetical protein
MNGYALLMLCSKFDDMPEMQFMPSVLEFNRSSNKLIVKPYFAYHF